MSALSRTEKELSKISHNLEGINKSLAVIAKALQPTIVVEPPKQTD